MSVYIGDGKRVSVRIVTDLAPKINEGTAIPRGERVDRIYFNTSLPQDKTNEILSQLTYTSIPGFDEPVNILYAWANENMDGHVIIAMQTELEAEEGRTGHYIIYFNCPFREDASFGTPILFNPRHHSDIIPGNGWYYDLYGENGDWGYINSGSISLLGFTDSGFQAPTEFNGLPIGAENEKIKNVLSITPFASGTCSKAHITDVTKLPEVADESKIYRVQEETVDKAIASFGGELLEDDSYTFKIVDELPEYDYTFTAYVLRDSGVGYLYLPNYGMWLTAGQLCEQVIGIALEDKGFITDDELEAGNLADGVYLHKVPYLTYGIPAEYSNQEIYERDKSGTWVQSGMQVLSSMIQEDTGATEITVPYGITRIRPYAFYHCQHLRKIKLPDTVEYILDHAFDTCSSLEEINIPSSVEYIGDGALKCNADFELPDKDMEIVKDAVYSGVWEDHALYNGPHILDVENNYPGVLNIRSGTKYIHTDIFRHARTVTGVTVPEGVISIHRYAFQNLRIKTLDLPESVEYLGNWIVIPPTNSTKTSVTLRAKTPPALHPDSLIDTGANIFDPWNITALYVPAESVDLYKNDPNYSNMADLIFPIEE